MPSVSIVLRTDRISKKGDAPINFFIIKDRRLSKVATGIKIQPKFWDKKRSRIKKGFPNAGRMNAFIFHKFTELQDEVFKHETNTKSLTTRQLKEKIYGKKPLDFFVFADEITERYLKSERINSYDKNKSILSKLKKYCNGNTLVFQDITTHFLSKYESYLRDELNNSTNTVNRDFKYIRKLFNDAIRVDLIEQNQNPFSKYQIKLEKTERDFLTEEELIRIENFKPTPGTRLEMHRDMFVFAAYAAGLRVSDVLQLQWKNFSDSHILFTIKKTSQQISIKLPQKAIAIINKYKPEKGKPDQFIFPMLPRDLDLNDARKVNTEISSATAYINKNLKIIAAKVGIEKRLSFHISRHTWATRALTKGMTIDKVSKLMGHTTIKETQIYAKIVNEELDKAMDIFNK